MNIVIELELAEEFLDPEDSTGVTAEAYDLIMEGLDNVAPISVSVHPV